MPPTPAETKASPAASAATASARAAKSNGGRTLVPSPPSVAGSDSIHPAPYRAGKPLAASVHAPLTDRQAVALELIELCQEELPIAKDAGRRARLHYECARLYESPLADLEHARDHYQKARASQPHHLPTLAGLRRVQLLQQNYVAALKILSEEIELAESPDIRGALLFERAVIMEQQLRRPQEARDSYAAALELLPQDAGSLRALSRAHRRDSDQQATCEILDAQISLSSEDPALLAARLTERGRVNELHPETAGNAMSYYQKALETDPLGSAALLHAQRLQLAEGRFSELAALLQQRVELLSDPRYRAASLAATADVLSEHLADVVGAIALLERAVEFDRSDSSPLMRLSHLYEKVGDHRARVRTLERLISVVDGDQLKLQLSLSLADAQRTHLRDTKEAVRWLEYARGLEPSNPLTADVLADLYREQGDYNQLAKVLEAEEQTSDDPEVRAQISIELAEIYERELNDVDRAILRHKAVLSLRPDHPAAFRSLARLLHRQRRFHELVEIHERAVELALDDAEAIGHLLQSAMIYEDLLDETEAALGIYRRILERAPCHLMALRGAQRLAEATGDYALAVDLSERELAEAQSDERRILLLLRAADMCERKLKDESRALSLLQSVLNIDDRNRPALAAIARLHRRQNRHNELVEVLLREADVVEKAGARAQRYLAIARIVEGQLADRDTALDHYKQAYNQGQSQLQTHALERALESAERFRELAEHLENRLENLGETPERYRVALDLARIRESRLGSPDQALEAFNAALDSVPDSLPATLGRIRCLGSLRDFAALVKELERIHQLTSDPAARLWSLLLAGDLWEAELAQPAQAILCFEQVLGIVPDHRGALLALERLYQGQERHADLIRVLQHQVQAFGVEAEQLAALRELLRVSENNSELKSLRQKAASLMLAKKPDDVRALLNLELWALGEGNADSLADIDQRWVKRTSPGVRRSAHRTRLAEYLETRNPLAALEQHRPALSEDAENIAAARGLTRLAEVVGDVALLRQAAETEFSVVRSAERAGSLLRQAANDARSAKRLDDAAEILARALSLNADDAASAAALHQVLVERAEYDRLIALLTTAANAAKDPEVRAGHWIATARLIATTRGDVGAGIAALSRVAMAEPNHVPVLLELAELYIRDRQWGPAAERLEQALEAAPDAPTAPAARLRLAELYHTHLERTQDAATLLTRLVAEAPQEQRALRRLLAIEIETKHPNAEATAKLWVGMAQREERAEALTTLGRLQRDFGKLTEAKQTLAQAVALVGVTEQGADRDLFRILEKEERAGQVADWSPYAKGLSEFCTRDAPPEARVRALVEASNVLIDRMRSREQGYGALRAALGLNPGNQALLKELARRLLEAKQYDRALTELYHLLALEPTQLETWTALSQTFDALGRNAEAHLALGPLVVLGGGTDLQKATWGSRHPNSAGIPEASADADTVQQAAGVELPEALNGLLTQLLPLAAKLLDAGPERYGLSVKDRVPPRSGHPMRGLLDRVTRIFSLPEVALYSAPGPSIVDVVLSEPVGVVIPEGFAHLAEAMQVFCLSYQVGRIACGLEVLAALGTEHTTLLLAAASASIGSDTAVPNLDNDDVQHMARRLTKAVPWLSKGRFEDAARRYAVEPVADLPRLFAALNQGSLRLAMVASDDLSCLNLLREHGTALLGLSPQHLGSTIGDLLRFWISPEALTLRRQLGLH